MHEGTHDFHACREHDFEVHHFFPKLKKLALRCIDVHFHCWISSGWFVVFYVTSKLLEEGSLDGSSYFMLRPNCLKRVVWMVRRIFCYVQIAWGGWSGWFVVFYVTSKLLKEGGLDGSSYFMLHPNCLKRVVWMVRRILCYIQITWRGWCSLLVCYLGWRFSLGILHLRTDDDWKL